MLADNLRQRNRALDRHVQAARALIAEAAISEELEPYRVELLGRCDEILESVEGSLALLDAGLPDILEEILSNTDIDWDDYQRISDELAAPVLRARESDRLPLRVIRWLHRDHAETKDDPAAFGSGACAILPVAPPLYYLPSVEQSSLLYQPLIFHEFGHLLYARHRREMDDLVGELQSELEELLLPASERGDRYSERKAEELEQVLTRWYSWAQELYCDAVGFQIGGPAFLRAFSAFLSATGEDDFYQSRDELSRTSHPVTWLRMKLLASRAERAGQRELAQAIRTEWQELADAIRIHEDYHGFYTHEAEEVLQRKIDDMLTETEPRSYLPEEVTATESVPGQTPVRLCSVAWHKWETEAEAYPVWERLAIESLLKSPLS